MGETWDWDWKLKVSDGSVIEAQMLVALDRFKVFYDDDENKLMLKDRYNHKYTLDFIEKARILGSTHDDPKLIDQ